ncbi:Uma2 family endonuclease [Nocardia sp. XZ_19_385]|uniref:Uma2 family endonuclease n=1 Tax=Nocardia sp. XZ_19_385 TaxID=2769488 RepID=UPI001E5DC850|nr:Uma2 family endonuclease [Nocardia sp. XZ_19_385]
MVVHYEFLDQAYGLPAPEGYRIDVKGDQIVMSPQRPAHWHVIRELEFQVRTQDSSVQRESDVRMRIPGWEYPPAPDFAVYPAGAALDAANTLFVAEVVSDSSREADYATKRRIYASAGVPEYLVVDPESGMWTLFTDPVDDSYTKIQDGSRGDSVQIAGFTINL